MSEVWALRRRSHEPTLDRRRAVSPSSGHARLPGDVVVLVRAAGERIDDPLVEAVGDGEPVGVILLVLDCLHDHGDIVVVGDVGEDAAQLVGNGVAVVYRSPRRLPAQLPAVALSQVRVVPSVAMSATAKTEAFALIVAAAQAGAPEISERPGDRHRSFLESTLEDALVRHLPGQTKTRQSKRRVPLEGFEPYPYGVDLVWKNAGTPVAVETKVSDAIDSLFDVVKLATAIAHGQFAEGYCAVAADARHWSDGGAFAEMAAGPIGEWRAWSVEKLLAAPAARRAVLVKTGPRPHTVPARIETMAAEPIAMPRAPTHTLRVLAVRPAVGTGWLQLPPRPS